MARIAGVNIPDNKRIEIGLTYIFGIGHSTALKILEETGIDPGMQGKDLTEEETIKLRDGFGRGCPGGPTAKVSPVPCRPRHPSRRELRPESVPCYLSSSALWATYHPAVRLMGRAGVLYSREKPER